MNVAKLSLRISLVLVLIRLLPADIIWNGGTGNWGTATNWTPQQVPGSSDNVDLNFGTANVTSAEGSINSLTQNGTASATLAIGAGGSLTIPTLSAGGTGIFSNSLMLSATGDGSQAGAAQLTLGNASASQTLMYINGGASLVTQANTAQTLNTILMGISGPADSSILTLGSGSTMNLNGLGMEGTQSTNGLTVNGAALNVTGNYNIFANSVINIYNGGTVSLGSSSGLANMFGSLGGNGTLNLANNISLSGSTVGAITAGITAATDTLQVNNTAAGGAQVTVNGGNMVAQYGASMYINGGFNLSGVNYQSSSPGAIVFSGANTVDGYAAGSFTFANGSVTTVNGLFGDNLERASAYTVDMQGNATLVLNSGADVYGGTYDLSAGAVIDSTQGRLVGATVNGAGTWEAPNGFTQNQGTTTVNGNLNAGTSSVQVTGGQLEGQGTITASDVNVSNATIKPGDSPGVLTIDGNLTLESSATTLIQWGGDVNSPGNDEYDELVVNGSADLNGYLNTAYMNLNIGYTPQAGDLFTILTCTDGCEGTFTGLDDYVSPNLHFALEYLGNSVDLVVDAGAGKSAPPPASAPEPGAWTLACFGLGLLTLKARRKVAGS